MKNKTGLFQPIIFSLFAAFAGIEFYGMSPEVNRAAQLMVAAIALVFAVAAGTTWIVWLLDEGTRRYQAIKLANVAPDLAKVSEWNKYANTIRQLTPEQAEVFGKGRAEIEVVPGNTGPIRTLMLAGGRVPWGFVEEFFKLCSEAYLCPVGWFSEGSNKQNWAIALTDYFVKSGYAVEAAGPNPAAWLAGKSKIAWLSVGYEPIEEVEE